MLMKFHVHTPTLLPYMVNIRDKYISAFSISSVAVFIATVFIAKKKKVYIKKE